MTGELNDWKNLFSENIITEVEQNGINGVSVLQEGLEISLRGCQGKMLTVSAQQEIRRSLIEYLDKLSAEISSRYTNIIEHCGFFRVRK